MMHQILIKDIVQPDWKFKEVDKHQFRSLKRSIHKNGQTKNIIVRRIEDGKFEIIDGRSVFKILSTMDKDFVYCYVYPQMSKVEAMLLYLEHDFNFENNFIDIGLALAEIHKEHSKLEISKHTRFSYKEIEELLELSDFDFSKLRLVKKDQQTKFF